MNEKNTNKSYEGLYSELFQRAELLHESNKRRIRRGLVGLIILPAVLIFIRWMTGSDKIVFLIIWIISMFILCAYLMIIEYLDNSNQNTLADVTDEEAEFDELLERPESFQGRLIDRLAELRAARIEAYRHHPEAEEDSASENESSDAPELPAVPQNETEEGGAE